VIWRRLFNNDAGDKSLLVSTSPTPLHPSPMLLETQNHDFSVKSIADASYKALLVCITTDIFSLSTPPRRWL
jgi:hypothetical protein